MEQAAGAEKFEEAARWRDLLRTIEDYRDRPGTISVGPRGPGRRRSGPRGRPRGRLRLFHAQGQDPRLRGTRLVDAPAGRPDAEVLADFLGRFLRGPRNAPRLLLPVSPARLTGLQTLLGWAKVRDPRPARRQEPQARRHGRPQRRGLPPQAGRRRQAPRGAAEGSRTCRTCPARSKDSTSPTPAARNRSAPSSSSATAGPTRTATGNSSSGRSRARTTWPASKRSSPGDTARSSTRRRPSPTWSWSTAASPSSARRRRPSPRLGLSDLPLVSIAKKEEILFTPAAPRRHPPRQDLARPEARPGGPGRDPPVRHRPPPRPPRKEELRLASRRHPGRRSEEEVGLLARYASLEAIRNAPRAELGALIGAAAAAKVLERLATQ